MSQTPAHHHHHEDYDDNDNTTEMTDSESIYSQEEEARGVDNAQRRVFDSETGEGENRGPLASSALMALHHQSVDPNNNTTSIQSGNLNDRLRSNSTGEEIRTEPSSMYAHLRESYSTPPGQGLVTANITNSQLLSCANRMNQTSFSLPSVRSSFSVPFNFSNALPLTALLCRGNHQIMRSREGDDTWHPGEMSPQDRSSDLSLAIRRSMSMSNGRPFSLVVNNEQRPFLPPLNANREFDNIVRESGLYRPQRRRRFDSNINVNGVPAIMTGRRSGGRRLGRNRIDGANPMRWQHGSLTRHHLSARLHSSTNAFNPSLVAHDDLTDDTSHRVEIWDDRRSNRGQESREGSPTRHRDSLNVLLQVVDQALDMLESDEQGEE